MKVKIRRAKIVDIPSLVEKLFDCYVLIREKGARDIAQDDGVLRGGVVIEVGNGFANPNWFCAVAVQEAEVIAFIIGMIEYCAPVSEHHKRVRILADYQSSDSVAGGKILINLWNLIESWAQENGVDGDFYANIHPGNQPSVRAAKHVGFKHRYTQFYRPVALDKKEEA